MKILKIEFQNINSLKGSHEIDFTKPPFTTSSLFAITGPTGSGKSTILDVISLALFNKIPRLAVVSNNEINKTGAIITRNQQEAMAAVTYEAKTGSFRSEWNISTARTGNLREYNMQISKVGTGELIDLKKSEVPKKNEELIGLNYDQFIKAVLLAQGEFARFLKASKSERGELLEKITGTGIYRQLGRKSYEKFKEENRVIETQQQRIAVIKENLLEEEQKKQFSNDLTQKETNVKELEKNILSLNKQLELKEKIAKQEKEIQIREKEQLDAENELKTFNLQHGFLLKQHEKIQAKAEQFRNWSQQKKELADGQTEQKSCEKSQNENFEARQECLVDTRNFIGVSVTSEEFGPQLEHFGKKIYSLQQERNDKLQEYKSIKNELNRALQGIEFQLNEENLAASEKRLLTLKKNTEEKISALSITLKDLDLENSQQVKENLSNRLELAQEAWRKDEEIHKITSDMKQLESEEEVNSKKLKEFPAVIELAKSNSELYQEKLEKFELQRENQILLATLEEHRHSLIDGKPCPLCGALKHPYSEGLPEKTSSLEIEITKIRRELDIWKNKLSAATANYETTKKGVEIISSNYANQKNDLKTKKAIFSNKYGHLCPDIENISWEKICRDWREQVQKIQKYQEEQRDLMAISEGIPLLRELQQIYSIGKKLKSELEIAYSGEDITKDIGEISNKWARLQQDEKNIRVRFSELEKKIEDKSSEIEELKKELLPFARKQGFENIENARKALMSESEFESLRSKREKFQTKITSLSSSLLILQSQLLVSKKADNPETSEKLREILEEKNKHYKELTEDCKELSRQLKNHSDNLKRLDQLQVEISEKEKQIRKWRLLNELIGDATGKKFNDFAQDLSLNQLLQLANIRLNDLSDRYRIDKPKKEEDDGLTAIDNDMGGQRRSVKTLSGGETFILSLSMALALSDLASKNVEINSLFIDEGFGTLDQETLDQTLDTLERLQAESSKTIGIISHVDSLKERITTQIQLKRNGQGYSSLEVK